MLTYIIVILIFPKERGGTVMKKILEELKNFDKSILKLMNSGIHFSFVFCLFATFILAIYQTVHIPNLFYIGISLFQTSLFFLVAFIAYAFIFNRMKAIKHT